VSRRGHVRRQVGIDPADPWHPEASEHPFVVDASHERAGPTDEGVFGCGGSLDASDRSSDVTSPLSRAGSETENLERRPASVNRIL